MLGLPSAVMRPVLTFFENDAMGPDDIMILYLLLWFVLNIPSMAYLFSEFSVFWRKFVAETLVATTLFVVGHALSVFAFDFRILTFPFCCFLGAFIRGRHQGWLIDYYTVLTEANAKIRALDGATFSDFVDPKWKCIKGFFTPVVKIVSAEVSEKLEQQCLINEQLRQEIAVLRRENTAWTHEIASLTKYKNDNPKPVALQQAYNAQERTIESQKTRIYQLEHKLTGDELHSHLEREREYKRTIKQLQGDLEAERQFLQHKDKKISDLIQDKNDLAHRNGSLSRELNNLKHSMAQKDDDIKLKDHKMQKMHFDMAQLTHLLGRILGFLYQFSQLPTDHDLFKGTIVFVYAMWQEGLDPKLLGVNARILDQMLSAAFTHGPFSHCRSFQLDLNDQLGIPQFPSYKQQLYNPNATPTVGPPPQLNAGQFSASNFGSGSTTTPVQAVNTNQGYGALAVSHPFSRPSAGGFSGSPFGSASTTTPTQTVNTNQAQSVLAGYNGGNASTTSGGDKTSIAARVTKDAPTGASPSTSSGTASASNLFAAFGGGKTIKGQDEFGNPLPAPGPSTAAGASAGKRKAEFGQPSGPAFGAPSGPSPGGFGAPSGPSSGGFGAPSRPAAAFGQPSGAPGTGPAPRTPAPGPRPFTISGYIGK